MLFENPKIGLLILAAGSSQRLGGNAKQLLEFAGKTLLRRAAETALETEFRPVVAVLGEDFEKLKNEIADLSVEAVYNGDARRGISASIKCGLEAVSGLNLDALVVCLCDQPLVSAADLRALGKSFLGTKSAIVAAAYSDTIGAPALFARSMFGELGNLTADEGAKKVIKKHFDKTVFVQMPAAAFDVDTAADYEKLTNFIE